MLDNFPPVKLSAVQTVLALSVNNLATILSIGSSSYPKIKSPKINFSFSTSTLIFEYNCSLTSPLSDNRKRTLPGDGRYASFIS